MPQNILKDLKMLLGSTSCKPDMLLNTLQYTVPPSHPPTKDFCRQLSRVMMKELKPALS